MTTRTASGFSRNAETIAAVREATAAALQQLGGAPQLGFIFTSSKHDLGRALAVAHEAAPGCELLGCHTAGEFTEAGAMRGGVVALLISSDSMIFEASVASGVRGDPGAVGKTLTAGFPDLVKRAASKGLGLSTTVLLVDGLAGTGERLVKEVLSGTRLFQQVVGGAAGDDGQFKATGVGTPRLAGSDVAAAVHVFDQQAWGVGVDHGLAPRTKAMTVTRARGNVVFEIDRRPAFEVYKEYAAAKQIALTPENTSHFLIGNELGVFFLDQLHHARAPVGVGANGELQLVAEIAEGAQVCILEGAASEMVAACGRAAKQAHTNLGGARAAGVLVFDCICRGMVLGREFQHEIEAVRGVFPDVPIAGFLSYGQIARYRGKNEGWHNSTAVVVAIPA